MSDRGPSTKDEFLNLLKEQKQCWNIVVIEQGRVGKSSFLNTAMSSISGEYSEKADVGHSQDSVTRHLRRFSAESYIQKRPGETEDDYFPQFIDIPGLDNVCTDENKFILEIVLFGVFPRDEQFKEVVQAYKELSFEDLKKKYGCMERYLKPNNLKVDRVIFVASAVDELPKELITAVVEVVRLKQRVIPLFGVLTHEDKVSKSHNISEKIKEFKSLLQLTDKRFLLCTNYCDDFFRKHPRSNNKTHRKIDEPVLTFLKNVCHQDFQILKPNVSYFTQPSLLFKAVNTHRDMPEHPQAVHRQAGLGMAGIAAAVAVVGCYVLIRTAKCIMNQ